MTKALLDLEAPWWEQFSELLSQEAQRFQQQFRPAFKLHHDPRDPQPHPEPYCLGNFVWRGEVAVQIGKAGQGRAIHRFTVDFVYPPLYPFQRIQVFPVTPTLRPSRHLEPCGNLCYMPHQPNAWTPSTTNEEVYRRIQNWFRGYLTDWRLADHVDVPEYRAYVRDLAAIEVFLPVHLYERLWGGCGTLEIQARKYRNHRQAIAERLVDLRRNKEYLRPTHPTLDRVLLGGGGQEHLQAVWLDVAKEPFINTASDLFEVVAASGPFRGNLEAAIWLDQSFQEYAVDKRLLIFLRFRVASTGSLQWSAYTLRPGSPTPLPFIEFPGLNPVIKRVVAWKDGAIQAVPLYPIRPRDLFRRLDGVYDAARLHKKHITVIGCGALGSPAAVLLTKAGVGHFTLVDGDCLTPGNVLRHALDLQSVGLPKASALSRQLQNINPYVKVEAVLQNVDSAPTIQKAIEKADAVVVAIADEAMEHLVSRVALQIGKTVLYIRGLASMAVGRIHRVIPGQDACPVCLCQHRGNAQAGTNRWIDVPERRPVLLYEDNCGAPAVPGAAVDTDQIAGLLARKTLDVLLGVSSEANQWVWVGRPLPNARDPRLHVAEVTYPLSFEPLEGCQECRPYQVAVQSIAITAGEAVAAFIETPAYHQVELTESARTAIIDESAACGKLEGGGVLAGYTDAQRGVLVITHATEGGPKAIHRTHYFLRDAAYCQAVLDEIHKTSGGKSDYVGEWHKHNAWDTTPSPTDQASLVNIVTQENYRVSQSLMLICGMPTYRHPEHNIIRAYSYRRGESDVRLLPCNDQ